MPGLTNEEILALYDTEMRIEPPVTKVRLTRLPGLTLCVTTPPGPRGGWISYTHLSEQEVEETIRAQIEVFRQDGREFEWKVYDHDTPASRLKDRLLAHGFEPEEPEALVVLDLEEAPTFLWQPVTADVRRITEPEGIDDVMRVQGGVWDEPFEGLSQELKRDLLETPHLLRVYLATVDGQPASSAWIRFYEGRQFADLWGGSTLPQYRGRGLYTALVAIRAQEARVSSPWTPAL